MVQAVLKNDLFETSTTCSGITKLVGQFKAATPLVISDETNGLEIQFSITGAGLFVEGADGGGGAGHPRSLHNQPINGYAGDFVPIFTKF